MTGLGTKLGERKKGLLDGEPDSNDPLCALRPSEGFLLPMVHLL